MSVVCNHKLWILNKVDGIDIKVGKYKDCAGALSFYSVKIWDFSGHFSQEEDLMGKPIAVLWLQLCLFKRTEILLKDEDH